MKKVENQKAITPKDKKAIAKKILDDKKKIHELTRSGKSIEQLAEERNIKFARPV